MRREDVIPSLLAKKKSTGTSTQKNNSRSGAGIGDEIS
jgi:hypothetical protein